MANNFSVGDHVRWNSEVGYVQGTITKIHTKDVDFKGRTRRCSPEEPQYEVESDKTGQLALHKGDALNQA